MPVTFPCKTCEKAVAENNSAGGGDTCNIWVHIKCNKINTETYNILKKENASWSCVECSKGVFPFSKLDNTNLLTTIASKNLKFMTIMKKHNTQEGILTDRTNDALNTSDLENSSTYFNVNEFNENLMLTHLRISMLSTLISLPFLITWIN